MKGMRCRKHPTDFSSAVGVCASCLRQRLLAIIAAQTLSQQPPHQQQLQSQPYPLPFPRSVSPYISRRKSDTTNDDHHHQQHLHNRFFNTPQVGPTGSVAVEKKGRRRSNKGLFSFLGIFRSKTKRSELNSSSAPISDPGASPSWFTTVGRKKQTRTFSLEDGLPIGVQRSIFRRRDRGMSPARFSDAEEDQHSSGYSSESSNWKQTPRRTPARRAAVANGRNLSVFCLSPLVRPSPCKLWSHKSTPPETAASGEARVPVKSHLSNAPSFCKNRSKKLADIGRYNYNSNY